MDYRLWLKPEDYPSWLCPKRPAELAPAPTTQHIIYDEPDEEEKAFYKELQEKHGSNRTGRKKVIAC